MADEPKHRVLVLGGGFGGLETAFSLRKLVGSATSITVVSDLDHFYFKPNSIYIPFGLDPAKLRVPLDRPMRRKGIELIQARARGIDPEARRVETEHSELDYDFLVIATGAGMRAEEIPGLPEHAHGTWTAEDMLRLGQAFTELAEAARSGERRRVLFLVPPNNKCAGPLYEIVLMLDTWLGKHGAAGKAEITWTTYEPTFIHAFGPRLHDVVAEEFDRRGISGHTGYVVQEVLPDVVRYQNGESLAYDLLVSFRPTSRRKASQPCPATIVAFFRPSSPAGRSSASPRSTPSETRATSRSSRPSWPSYGAMPRRPTSAPEFSTSSRPSSSTRSACA
jgi:sulfide:quinone oxidoreductase